MTNDTVTLELSEAIIITFYWGNKKRTLPEGSNFLSITLIRSYIFSRWMPDHHHLPFHVIPIIYFRKATVEPHQFPYIGLWIKINHWSSPPHLMHQTLKLDQLNLFTPLGMEALKFHTDLGPCTLEPTEGLSLTVNEEQPTFCQERREAPISVFNQVTKWFPKWTLILHLMK